MAIWRGYCVRAFFISFYISLFLFLFFCTNVTVNYCALYFTIHLKPLKKWVAWRAACRAYYQYLRDRKLFIYYYFYFFRICTISRRTILCESKAEGEQSVSKIAWKKKNVSGGWFYFPCIIFNQRHARRGTVNIFSITISRNLLLTYYECTAT